MSRLRGVCKGLSFVCFVGLCLFGSARHSIAQPPKATRTPLVRVVDLDVGESLEVELCNGKNATVKLLDLEERKDTVCEAVREARAKVEVNGQVVTLVSATYHLPTTIAGVQIDCPITKGYLAVGRANPWGLEKDARLRLWPAGSPLIAPGTFVFPARGLRWFASDTQMANDPVYVDGGERPGPRKVYYHSGLDFGGPERMVDVLAATDGRVVSAAGKSLPDFKGTPVGSRYDVVYTLDDRGWYYRYSHMDSILPEIKPGVTVRKGQQIGVLGKEGASGGWSHLHFEIKSRQPSGQWGTQAGYAFVWEAYRSEFKPNLIAVARPHKLAWTGEKVVLDGSKSWAASGRIARYDWTFTDGTTASGPTIERTYNRAGSYSEILKITDDRGHVAYDFAVVQILDKSNPKQLPPTIHACFSPTFDIQTGDPVTFKVRTFRTTDGSETWDFGDGSSPVTVRSDGNVDPHAKDGYAVTVHRYEAPGDYLARVERSNSRGQKAVGRVHVRVTAGRDAP